MFRIVIVVLIYHRHKPVDLFSKVAVASKCNDNTGHVTLGTCILYFVIKLLVHILPNSMQNALHASIVGFLHFSYCSFSQREAHMAIWRLRERFLLYFASTLAAVALASYVIIQ
jgi:hypothetical protein